MTPPNYLILSKHFSDDIGMEFGIDKCAVVVIKRGKRKKIDYDGVKLPDGQLIRDVDDQGYKYLGILESDVIYT